MKLIPFRKHGAPKPDAVRFAGFHPPRELAEYGFDGAKPKKQDGSPSGFLLPWSGIDAERDRRVHGGACHYVVVGEYIDNATDRRWPALAVNADWMEERGYTRFMGVENGRVKYGPWTHRSAPA